MTTEKPVKTPPISKLLHFNPQSKGNLGKSLEVEMRTAWLDRHGIDWRGSDLDDRHRTFSRRRPNAVKSYRFGNEREAKEEFVALLRGVLRDPHPVHVVDTRAQADELFIRSLEQINVFERCREEGVRMTFFLFPSDETESMENFRALVQFGERSVNYVVVENPVKGGNKLFNNSALQKTLVALGAKTIRLPAITSPTMISMEHAEHKAKRGISLGEFASPSSGHMEPILVGEIQWVLGQMFEQYDAIADLLLPRPFAAEIQALRAKHPPRKPKISDEDFGFNFED